MNKTLVDAKLIESMRRDWDERARKDAYFYIATWRKDWEAVRPLLPLIEEFHGLT